MDFINFICLWTDNLLPQIFSFGKNNIAAAFYYHY